MKYPKDGHYHLMKALQSEKAGDHAKARGEYLKSAEAFIRERAGKAIDPSAGRTNSLTPREREVFSQLIAGTAPKEIAVNLGISYETVHFHQKNLYRKLNIQSRAELFALYINKP